MRPRLVVSIAGVLAAAALSGCGGSSVNLGTPGAAVGGKVPGGTLQVAIASAPDQLDPQKTTSYPSFEVLDNIYDTLVAPDPKTLRMEPSLAQSWTVSRDRLRWTFQLRRGVRFDDGSAFDASDVVYSYDRIIHGKLPNAYRFATVKAVTARGPHAVVLTLAKPTPNLLSDIGGFKGMSILPKGIASRLNLATHTDGTGPYMLQSQNPGSITLVANPHYWGKGPYVDRVVFQFIPNATTAVTALETGEIDWTDNIPPQDISNLQRNDTLKVATVPSTDYWYMTVNEQRGPFGNPLVRRAISYAINRKAITEAAMFNAATVNETAIPKTSPWYSSYSPYTQNLDKARALLRQAGVSHLSMGLMVTSEYPQTVEAAQVIAAELAKVGIQINVQTEDFSTWLDRESKGEYDSFILGWLGNIDPSDYYYDQQYCKAADNFQHYCNKQVDRLLDTANTTSDTARRKQLYDRAARLIVDDNSYIYLYNPDVVQAWSGKVKGFIARPDRAINFNTVRLSK
ncbi:MAG TPA: ABC transporter substrate-binding protein [Solirubrobacteraceae bacterium]